MRHLPLVRGLQSARALAHLILLVAIGEEVGVKLLNQLNVGDINEGPGVRFWLTEAPKGVNEVGDDEGFSGIVSDKSIIRHDVSMISIQDKSIVFIPSSIFNGKSSSHLIYH